MTKIKVQDAARQLGAGAKELMDRISGTRKGTQDTLGALRKLEEQLSAKEAQAREEAERVRAEQERIQEEQDRIDAAKAQDEALRAAVLAERARREAAPTAENQENTQEPAKAEAPKAEAPKAEAAQPAACPIAMQHGIMRTAPAACDSADIERPATIRSSHPSGKRLRYGTVYTGATSS